MHVKYNKGTCELMIMHSKNVYFIFLNSTNNVPPETSNSITPILGFNISQNSSSTA